MDDLVGHGLRPLSHVRQTDIDVRIAVEDSPGFLAAGRISAGAAVEFVLGPELAGTVQYLLYLLRRRHQTPVLNSGISGRNIHSVFTVSLPLGRQYLALSTHIPFHIHCGPHSLSVSDQAARPAHTGILAHIHLEEHSADLVDVLQGIYTVLRTVHRHIVIALGTGLEGMDDAAAYRIGLAAVGRSLPGNAGTPVSLSLQGHGIRQGEGQSPLHHQPPQVLEGQHS